MEFAHEFVMVQVSITLIATGFRPQDELEMRGQQASFLLLVFNSACFKCYPHLDVLCVMEVTWFLSSLQRSLLEQALCEHVCHDVMDTTSLHDLHCRYMQQIQV